VSAFDHPSLMKEGIVSIATCSTTSLLSLSLLLILRCILPLERRSRTPDKCDELDDPEVRSLLAKNAKDLKKVYWLRRGKPHPQLCSPTHSLTHLMSCCRFSSFMRPVLPLVDKQGVFHSHCMDSLSFFAIMD
jgi:hypothetical protein